MAKPTKVFLENKFGCPCFVRWDLVPVNFHPRGWYESNGVIIPKNAKPDAVKGGGGYSRHYSFLFKEEKYLSEEQRTKIIQPTFERPKLKVNFEK